ncbi:MAG: YwiC-like family protein [Chloroflexi bacterium]|nr:YwiC-like family protein [Chloroflexota bacterium]
MKQTATSSLKTEIGAPVLPDEHGSWGTFLGSFLAATASTGLGADVWLTFVAGLGLFLAREPLHRAVKLRFGRRPRPIPPGLMFWAAVYLLVAGAAGLWLIFGLGYVGLLALGLVGALILFLYLRQAARRAEMTAWGQWVGVIGVSLIIPAVYYVHFGYFDAPGAALWLLGLASVTGPILYVRLKVRVQARRAQVPPPLERLKAAWRLLGFYAAAIFLAFLATLPGWLPPLAPLALAPAAIKAAWGAWHWTPRGQLNIRRIGFVEVGVTILFAAILFIAYRLV